MSTGHELNDRNAGPGPNHLLIRTTCFRKFEFSSEPIAAYDGTHWKEGYAKVGAGLTWGRNFWWDLENSVGVYPLAAENDREAVGGTCHSGNHYYKQTNKAINIYILFIYYLILIF